MKGERSPLLSPPFSVLLSPAAELPWNEPRALKALMEFVQEKGGRIGGDKLSVRSAAEACAIYRHYF